jgi:hypothetical protein
MYLHRDDEQVIGLLYGTQQSSLGRKALGVHHDGTETVVRKT